MKKKTIAGLVIMVLSIAAMIFWEVSAREMLTTEEILAASRPIEKGTRVGADRLKIMRAERDRIPEGALRPGDMDQAAGMTALVDIRENMPLTRDLIGEENEGIGEGLSIYSLPPEWIASRPAMLRAGDRAKFYALPEKELLGEFEIAFLRDSGEIAVTGDEEKGSDVLLRNSAGGIISSVEIICGAEDFFRIYDRSLGPAEADINEEGPAEGAAPETGEEVAGALEEWYKAGAPGGYPYSGSDDENEEPAPFILIVPEV
ncbi:MAG: SAF domain-containing protein [Firmicutes bacterium]|nr:SAF domain-containing protein [Bacillota bacterium]